MKSKDQQLLEEAYAQIICEELDRNWKSLTFNKGLDSVIQSGEGSEESPFVPQIWTDIYLLAGILRDYSKDTNQVYYYIHNNQLYKATGENKLIKVGANNENGISSTTDQKTIEPTNQKPLARKLDPREQSKLDGISGKIPELEGIF